MQTDKDECQIETSKICGEHTSCHNTHGSFYCVCLEGYQASNSKKTFIPNDGTYCTEISCGIPPEIRHGYILGNYTTVLGSKVHYECEKGFYGEGGKISTCTKNEIWEPSTLNCKEISCGIPPEIRHGYILGNYTTVLGSKVHYECEKGFYGEGGKISTCTKNEIWEPSTLNCKEISCGIPPEIRHGYILGNYTTVLGSKVHYECEKGFYGEGGNISTCTKNEIWEPSTLNCKEISCGIPPEIRHGYILGNYTTVLGSKVHYECEKGFYGEGGNISTCTKNEIWEPSTLNCKAVDCGVPPFVPNAISAPLSKTTYGNEVFYICQSGYVVKSGSQAAVCNAKGQWEGADLVCKELDCGRPLWIPHAEMIWNNSTTLGSMVYYKCKEGFQFNGDRNFSLCTISQMWENITVECKGKYKFILFFLRFNALYFSFN
uniref:Uncharacterized protein n=1 Tax=Sphenodon punctatus TaxID=8508 RepID=A0A8D0L603_SPHPU